MSLLLHVINDHTNLLTNPITVLLKSFQQSHVPKEVVFVQALTQSRLCSQKIFMIFISHNKNWLHFSNLAE